MRNVKGIFDPYFSVGFSPQQLIGYGHNVHGCTIVFSVKGKGGLIAVQVILLRSGFERRQYLQIIVGTIFSLSIDFSMMLVSFLNPADYLSQFATLLLSCVVVAFGVMLEVQTEVVYLPPDGIIVAISKVLKKEFPKVKPFVDTSFVITAAILSIVFLGYLAGVREGTIISALIIGPIVKVLQTYLNPYVERLYEK